MRCVLPDWPCVTLSGIVSNLAFKWPGMNGNGSATKWWISIVWLVLSYPICIWFIVSSAVWICFFICCSFWGSSRTCWKPHLADVLHLCAFPVAAKLGTLKFDFTMTTFSWSILLHPAVSGATAKRNRCCKREIWNLGLLMRERRRLETHVPRDPLL